MGKNNFLAHLVQLSIFIILSILKLGNTAPFNNDEGLNLDVVLGKNLAGNERPARVDSLNQNRDIINLLSVELSDETNRQPSNIENRPEDDDTLLRLLIGGNEQTFHSNNEQGSLSHSLLEGGNHEDNGAILDLILGGHSHSSNHNFRETQQNANTHDALLTVLLGSNEKTKTDSISSNSMDKSLIEALVNL